MFYADREKSSPDFKTGIMAELKQSKDTLLHRACDVGNIDIVKMIIEEERKRPERNISVRNWDGKTPLHYACQGSHQKIVELLIKE